MSDDDLYKAFLSELEALEKFRISYTGLHPSIPLSREDPDVRRMIEAMAMFTARTRRASERGVGLSMLRLFRQHFSFLLSPLPAMAMLKAAPSARFVQAATVPRGTEVTLASPPPAPGESPVPALTFRTLAPLTLLPLELDRVDLFIPEARGPRIVLAFEAQHDRVEDLHEISLYINHLNDFASSLMVQSALSTHLERSSIVFDEDVGEATEGSPCDLSFGGYAKEAVEVESFEHPLQEVRAFLAFPQTHMFMNVRLRHAPRERWRRCSLILDLDRSFPRDLKVGPDTFQLHCVPMVNLRREMADPIEYDATRERYPILHPEVPRRFRLHQVIGVYRLDAADGLVPLRPGAVGDVRDAYEIETEGRGDQRRGYLTLDMPSAFMEPFRVAIDATWHQPLLEGDRDYHFQASLHDRYYDGVRWSCLGGMSIARDGELGEDVGALLRLLAIKNQRFLRHSELRFLLEALGASRSRVFAPVMAFLTDVEVESKPYARGTTGFKYVYHLTFRGLDRSEVAALDLLARKVRQALTAWSIEEVVELVVRVPNLEKVLRYD